jgi:hypothetical protein
MDGLRVLCYQCGGDSWSGLQPAGFSEKLALRCSGKAHQSKADRRPSAQRRIIRVRPRVWPNPPLMRRIIPRVIPKTDSEAVATVADAPGRCVTSRSSADYSARGVPRGRRSHDCSGVVNLSRPVRGRGEKRFRSALFPSAAFADVRVRHTEPRSALLPRFDSS